MPSPIGSWSEKNSLVYTSSLGGKGTIEVGRSAFLVALIGLM
jgi:hypothetical protein